MTKHNYPKSYCQIQFNPKIHLKESYHVQIMLLWKHSTQCSYKGYLRWRELRDRFLFLFFYFFYNSASTSSPSQFPLCNWLCFLISLGGLFSYPSPHVIVWWFLYLVGSRVMTSRYVQGYGQICAFPNQPMLEEQVISHCLFPPWPVISAQQQHFPHRLEGRQGNGSAADLGGQQAASTKGKHKLNWGS